MNCHCTLSALLAGLSLACLTPVVAASPDALSYVRLYAGSDGISHFADEQLVLTPAGTAATPEDRLYVHRLGDLNGVMFARLKAGVTEDWHVAPRRQFMLCVRGIVEITAGDGEKRRMTPGQFMLLEDTSGRGHRTHAAGAEDHVALALPVPDGIPSH
ncbi:MAG TPA: hypothetical protein VGL50_07165 [Steroidobacteraceae bacterium]|jgi:quercetin dioxygenase-like cupin family protein